jgi:glycosyltransferase involved in cell wall biosynthesis
MPPRRREAGATCGHFAINLSPTRSEPIDAKAAYLKLIIQIPCFNEAQTLPFVLSALPRSVPGFDTFEWLVIDEGSGDDTARVAKQHGVDHVICHTSNQGLAKAFMTGLDACLSLGADVIVNTDADNQYNADDIPTLTKPILDHRAELVIGARPIRTILSFLSSPQPSASYSGWAAWSCGSLVTPRFPMPPAAFAP